MASVTPIIQDTTLTYQQEGHSTQLLVDSPDWYRWLGNATTFTYRSEHGPLTARKERAGNKRGGEYWKAYRRRDGKLHRVYLGKSEELTLERLKAVATILAGRGPAKSYARTNAGESGKAPLHDFPLLRTLDTSPDTLPIQRDPLLSIKLHPPRPRSRLVARSYLVERLQQGMERPLTLVSAPAGFGKTTLLAQWLTESGTPIAWLSLEPEDNEPMRFFCYVLSALQTLHPQLGTVVRTLLEAPQPGPLERVLTLLISDILEHSTGDFALALDDYHVIEANATHRGMGFLLEHLPPHMHLIIATRADPPLPLGRLRARGQLTEVRATDLRFDANEAGSFLHTVMGLDLSAPDIAVLERRTEGWIAGLQLASLALQGRAEVSVFLSGFTGSHRFVFDYLSEEVLSRQPEQVQAFLLHTSILERLSGPLCDAVTGQQKGQATLAALDQANLFVVPLDDERHWYRYHHLFAEVLRNRLQQTDPTLVSQLHLRASAWYEQQGLFVGAVQHALAASDVGRAADLIENIDVGSWAGLGEHVHRVLDWLERLPDTLVRTRPLLCIAHAVALMFTNQLREAEARLQAAEHCLEAGVSAEQSRVLRGQVLAIRGNIARYMGDLVHCVVHSQQALQLLPEEEMTMRPIAKMNAAHAFLVSGDVSAVPERLAADSVTSMRASGNPSGTLRGLTTLARLQVVQGRLRQAAATYEEAAGVAPGQEGLQALVGSPAYYFGLGDVLREWNVLDVAEPTLSLGMELVRGSLAVDAEMVTLGYLTLARLQMARAEHKQALTTLDTLTRLGQERSFAPNLIARGAAIRAQVELAKGDLRAAASWVEQRGISTEDDNLGYLREREYLTLARVRIAQRRVDPSASFFQNTLQLLDRLLQDAQAKARRSSILELLLLQCLAKEAQGERDEAFSRLKQALSLAEPEGYVRLFVDEGVPMLALLRQAQVRGIVPHYVALLLTAFGEPLDAARLSSDSGALIDPLTGREREVLQLLAEGASNREIAQRLILSVGTVKKYVFNICGKLGVQSRTQALARARALHLL
jgi:ATP/maltotriose-dependent transcriptional regulator MalT